MTAVLLPLHKFRTSRGTPPKSNHQVLSIPTCRAVAHSREKVLENVLQKLFRVKDRGQQVFGM